MEYAKILYLNYKKVKINFGRIHLFLYAVAKKKKKKYANALNSQTWRWPFFLLIETFSIKSSKFV